jgi:aminoglycoside 2''-phosphotransferase
MDNTLISPLTQPYLDAIRAAYPDLEVHSSLLVRNGQYNDILILNDLWAFRFPRYSHGVEEMLAEFCLLDKIAPYLTLSIPQPVYHSSSLQVGQAFTGYRFIPGISLYRNVLQSLAQAVQVSLASQLANFLVELHSLPVQDFCPDAPANDQAGNWTEMYFKVRTLLILNPF